MFDIFKAFFYLLEISLIINTNIASRIGPGAVSWINYADRLMEFPTALLGVAVLAAVGWCAVPRVMEQRRFDGYLDQLRREPGVVVGSAGRADGRFVLTGLRDPLARDPIALAAADTVVTTPMAGGVDPLNVAAAAAVALWALRV